MADEEQDEHTIASCVRGYHVYQEFWTPTTREILSCQRQPSNIRDRYVVSVHNRSGEVVAHLPRRLSRMFSLFLCRGGVVIYEVHVTRTRRCSTDLPQGGLKIPCLLRIKGKKKLISTLKKLIKCS